MSNFNYMDNVPVKIAESYRPPPRLYQMPQAIANRLALPTNYYENAKQYSYDFQLERILLRKLPEWSRLRQNARVARRERILKREQERQQQLDAKEKQLLGAVSYPSTEDLSSCSSESEQKTVEEIKPIVTNSFHNILQPTILLPTTDNSTTSTQSTIHCNKSPYNNSNNNNMYGNNFNYQDFEAGTSSPFDDIELKTINDLDILAQVLHNTQLKIDNNQIDNLKHNNNKDKDEEKLEENLNNKDIQTNIPTTQEQEQQTSQEQNQLYNGYINTTTTFQLLNQNYDVYNNLRGNSNIMNYNLTNSNIPTTTKAISSPTANVTEIKSKSVPDILQELRHEIHKSEISHRSRNCSETLEDVEQLEEPKDTKTTQSCYEQLEAKIQNLAKDISSMGYPLERVARIALIYGNNDEKIIEHLIPLSELMDLGFTETDISAALLKYDNNKEKALEHLIS